MKVKWLITPEGEVYLRISLFWLWVWDIEATDKLITVAIMLLRDCKDKQIHVAYTDPTTEKSYFGELKLEETEAVE